MELEYNSTKEPLILMEYGRNVQKLVKYISSLEDKEERSKLAHTLINLMKQLNPSVKENNDNYQRIWDHLFIMSDFELDIDAPYPMPDKEILISKPKKMEYKTTELRFKHYGRNIELLIAKAIEIEDVEEQERAILHLGKLMKSFYSSWNKENISDDVIVHHLYELSGKRIDYRPKLKEGKVIFDLGSFKEREKRGGRNGGGNNNGGKRRSSRDNRRRGRD
ncbi:DUF4290 domain-containing protein [Flexithrix dorotheae]|uniref:DUF4290 domain-containing protein n=1 Tax=Flexithrix dorotheae TaxID=70993 RepID=UPI00035F40DC|nr:DUF4290 domain-containing protein [Flexithrix dorotheae]